MVTNKHIAFLILSFIMMATLSCHKTTEERSSGDRINFRIVAALTSQTRQTAAETEIDEVYALVFVDNGDGYAYQYGVRGVNITSTGEFSTQFNMTLFTQSNAVKVYILANANSDVIEANLQIGDIQDSVKHRMIDEFPSEGIGAFFPMWGEYEFPSGISTELDNTSISMDVLRAVARVDVTTTEVPVALFEMQSVEIFRASSLFQNIPNSYTATPSMTVTAPSVPETSSAGVATYPLASTSASSSIAQLYLPEAVAPAPENLASMGCCVIVGGIYNSSGVTTYYRLDFTSAAYPAGQILRNHQYTFNITDVTGPGAPTAEDAASEEAAGIIAQMIDWTDVFFNSVMWGTNFFNIQSRSITMESEASTSTILVQTSLPQYYLSWSDSGGQQLGPLAQSIENDNLSVEIGVNGLIVTTLSDNEGGGARVNYVLIVAGRDRILVKITQLGV